MGAAQQKLANLVRFALFGKVEGHRRGRRDGVEQGPTRLTVITVVDVDPAEERGRRIGTHHHLGSVPTDQFDERGAQVFVIGHRAVDVLEARDTAGPEQIGRLLKFRATYLSQ